MLGLELLSVTAVLSDCCGVPFMSGRPPVHFTITQSLLITNGYLIHEKHGTISLISHPSKVALEIIRMHI